MKVLSHFIQSIKRDLVDISIFSYNITSFNKNLIFHVLKKKINEVKKRRMTQDSLRFFRAVFLA